MNGRIGKVPVGIVVVVAGLGVAVAVAVACAAGVDVEVGIAVAVVVGGKVNGWGDAVLALGWLVSGMLGSRPPIVAPVERLRTRGATGVLKVPAPKPLATPKVTLLLPLAPILALRMRTGLF